MMSVGQKMKSQSPINSTIIPRDRAIARPLRFTILFCWPIISPPVPANTSAESGQVIIATQRMYSIPIFHSHSISMYCITT